MKIYINNLNLNSLNSIQTSLSDLIVETQLFTELYTNESIYHVDNKHVYILEPKDGDITVYQNYFNNITLVVDNSYFQKTEGTSINGVEHVPKKIKKLIHKLNTRSKISFIIEMAQDINNNYIPSDVYFESDEILDIKELFIKQELIEFLSLLN